MKFDPQRPMCDGILFRDLWMLHDFEYQNVLAARGVVYLTDFQSLDGRPYRGSIIAKSRSDAELIAFGRGLGETVGQLLGVIAYTEE